MTAPITVFLVDDHDVVRRGLRAYAEVRPDIEVVGEASDGEQAIARIDALAAAGAEPDVVLMDLVLPGMDGVAVTASLLRHHPGLRVLILTSFGGQQRVQMALAAGAAGYLLKSKLTSVRSPPASLRCWGCWQRAAPTRRSPASSRSRSGRRGRM
jgi:DNA-binding NarL/FixJ family response regulator